VQIELSPDQTFNAKPSSVEVHVQENIGSNRTRLLSSGALCCLSPLLLIVGLGMVIGAELNAALAETPEEAMNRIGQADDRGRREAERLAAGNQEVKE